jgi:hypothetical protein
MAKKMAQKDKEITLTTLYLPNALPLGISTELIFLCWRRRSLAWENSSKDPRVPRSHSKFSNKQA